MKLQHFDSQVLSYARKSGFHKFRAVALQKHGENNRGSMTVVVVELETPTTHQTQTVRQQQLLFDVIAD